MKIQALTLYTSQLETQLSFYKDTLRFQILESTESSFTLSIGRSQLQFIKSKNTTPYHFAFNIPANQEDAALSWLEQRVNIIKYGELEIIDFEDWQAKAVYFYDACNNLVEFISRRRIQSEIPEPFTIDSVLSISEIGLVTDEIEAVYQKLNSTGIEIFDGNMHRFCAAGDDHGLFIIINPTVKNWFPTGEKAYYSPFEVDIEVEEKRHRLQYTKNSFQFQ